MNADSLPYVVVATVGDATLIFATCNYSQDKYAILRRARTGARDAFSTLIRIHGEHAITWTRTVCPIRKLKKEVARLKAGLSHTPARTPGRPAGEALARRRAAHLRLADSYEAAGDAKLAAFIRAQRIPRADSRR